MGALASQLSDEIKQFGLEPYVLELESEGMTIVPPEVTGVAPELLDRCTEVLLGRFTEMTGCPISIEEGPMGELAFPDPPAALRARAQRGKPTQMLIQQLLQLDRCFRDLFVNPVVDALICHLTKTRSPGALATPGRAGRARRLSSTNAFVKWQTRQPGSEGDPLSLPLHPDQGATPLPWGATALTANATWMLTHYTREDGCLAYVPGSHRANAFPGPDAVERAVPAEGPRGAVAIWPGSMWHGAFPKFTPGLRLNAVAYYRHYSILPQENLHMTMADQPLDDCDNAALLRELIGLDDPFPYGNQMMPVPKLVEKLSA